MSLQECQCCFKEKQRVSVCSKQHVICKDCQQRLGRQDCLFCKPHIDNLHSIQIQVAPNAPNAPNVQTHTRASQPNLARNTLYCIRDTLIFMCYLARFVGAFLILVYVGKLFICLYFLANPDRDDSWFAWDRFNYVLGEALVGLVVLGILGGCCLGNRS